MLEKHPSARGQAGHISEHAGKRQGQRSGSITVPATVARACFESEHSGNLIGQNHADSPSQTGGVALNSIC
jgi:hypothetical protein